MLDQLKGARIEMQFGSEKVSGAMVAARLIAGDKDRAEREQVTLLLDNGDLRNFDLGAAATLRFSDLKLQSQFKDYLAAVTAARSTDRRSVYIDSTDAKSREVMASYMIPTPIWKSSYRLILTRPGNRCWKAGPLSTTLPERIGSTSGYRWFQGSRFRLSANSISRVMYSADGGLAGVGGLAPVIHGGAIGGVLGSISPGIAAKKAAPV